MGNNLQSVQWKIDDDLPEINESQFVILISGNHF